MDVDRLTELFGERPEGQGKRQRSRFGQRIGRAHPQRGEVIEDGALRFEILEARTAVWSAFALPHSAARSASQCRNKRRE